MRSTPYNLSRWKPFFFTIWSGQALSLFGSILVDFALVWHMTTATGSAIVLTTASMVTMFPAIFLSPILGSLVDRWKRRSMIILADSMTAFFTIILALLFWSDAVQLWHIYVLLFVRAITGFTHFVSMDVSTSLMVPQEQLTRIAGLNRTLQGIMQIAGPPLGALFMTILPIQSILLIDVGTALIAILPLVFIILPEPDRKTIEAKGMLKVSIFEDILEGYHYVRSWKGLMSLMVLFAVANFLLHPVFSLSPLLITEYFGGGALQLGWLQTSLGVGTIAGGLLLGSWGGFRKRIATMLMGGILEGVGLLIIALPPSSGFPIALAGAFIVGGALALVDGPLMAILQANVAPEIQGRVIGFLLSTSRLAAPLGLLLAGMLTERFGVRFWFFFGAVGLLLMILIALAIPALARIEEGQYEEECTLLTG